MGAHALDLGAEAIVKADVATLGPPKLEQFSHERLDTPFHFRIGLRSAQQHANAPHSLGLLRVRRKRPACRCAAQ